MLKDMGHAFGKGEPVYDVTFENVQAGLRTDYLFRLANHHGGIVIGTGDLSELALGWCTYGVGDQMAHYNVNSGVPKTLIQHLIRWVISSGQFSDDVSQTLRAIIAAEISPELVPVDEGQKPQSTEAAIGPYALQDFSLFHTLRFGFRPPRSPFWQCTPGKKIRQPIGRWVCRPSSDTITNWPISGNGWKSFCGGFLPSVSSNVPQCRTARRSQQVVRCHRGAIGGRRPTAMLRRGWKILSATYRIKLDSLGGHKRAGQVTVTRFPGLRACGATCYRPGRAGGGCALFPDAE